MKYTYDRHGNRFQSGSSDNFGVGFTPVVNNDIDPATNRFIETGSTPVVHNAAGNITSDMKFRSLKYTYDINNRVRMVDDPGDDGVQLSFYDGAGQRVQTLAHATNVTRTSVYDIFGQVVTDYTGSTGATLERENIYRGGQLLATYEGSTLKYVLPDAQGSTRAIMNNNGSGTSSVIARHDYLPFGEEVGSAIGSRIGTQGYGATDLNRQKYGLTERDDPTGLDHTWFRKYENSSGRFTSPDPYRGSMAVADPQSFNRYSYTQNDPVNFVDPTGLDDDPGPPPDCGPGMAPLLDEDGHWRCAGVGAFTVNVPSDPWGDPFDDPFFRGLDDGWDLVMPELIPEMPLIPLLDPLQEAKKLDENLHCNREVRNQINAMFTRQQASRSGGSKGAEFGFAVDYVDGKYSVSQLYTTGSGREVTIPVGPNTVARIHTHQPWDPNPSPGDRTNSVKTKTISYVKTIGSKGLKLFNPQHPTDASGAIRNVQAADCPR